MSRRMRVYRRRESGAAAVEFALVMPILFLAVFGIIQYGLWFNDSLNVRTGRPRGRPHGRRPKLPCLRAVKAPTPAGCTARPSLQINALTGTEYVKVVTPATWAKNNPLIVCALVKSDGVIGSLRDAERRLDRASTTEMSIEQDATPLPTGTPTQDALPAGAPAYPCCTGRGAQTSRGRRDERGAGRRRGRAGGDRSPRDRRHGGRPRSAGRDVRRQSQIASDAAALVSQTNMLYPASGRCALPAGALSPCFTDAINAAKNYAAASSSASPRPPGQCRATDPNRYYVPPSELTVHLVHRRRPGQHTTRAAEQGPGQDADQRGDGRGRPPRRGRHDPDLDVRAGRHCAPARPAPADCACSAQA